MNENFCQYSGKAKYPNPQQAHTGVSRLNKKNAKKNPGSIYKCPSCKLWHITHKNDENRRREY